MNRNMMYLIQCPELKKEKKVEERKQTENANSAQRGP